MPSRALECLLGILGALDSHAVRGRVVRLSLDKRNGVCQRRCPRAIPYESGQVFCPGCHSMNAPRPVLGFGLPLACVKVRSRRNYHGVVGGIGFEKWTTRKCWALRPDFALA